MTKYSVIVTLRDKFFNLLQEKVILVSAVSKYQAILFAEQIAFTNYPEVAWIKAIQATKI